MHHFEGTGEDCEHCGTSKWSAVHFSADMKDYRVLENESLREQIAALAKENARLKEERDELAKWASLALFAFPEAINDVVESAREYAAEATACDNEDACDLEQALEICGWDDLARTTYENAERIIAANIAKV